MLWRRRRRERAREEMDLDDFCQDSCRLSSEEKEAEVHRRPADGWMVCSHRGREGENSIGRVRVSSCDASRFAQPASGLVSTAALAPIRRQRLCVVVISQSGRADDFVSGLIGKPTCCDLGLAPSLALPPPRNPQLLSGRFPNFFLLTLQPPNMELSLPVSPPFKSCSSCLYMHHGLRSPAIQGPPENLPRNVPTWHVKPP